MKTQKIVITGGPSGGKTTLIEALSKDLSQRLAVVPEAASILYRGGFPRRPSDPSRRHAQRAIYFVQNELEALIGTESTKDALVCDRGSLDSVAYWPGSESDFFASLETNRAQEFARYDWVLHLDTADGEHFDSSNPIRIESHREALELNSRVKQAWEGHPQRIVIPHAADFLHKISRAKSVIQAILRGETWASINAQYGESH